MRMMERLLSNVGRSWDRTPNELPAITVQRGGGAFSLLTIEGSQLHLHNLPYREDLPLKQSVDLDKHTIEEVAMRLRELGYEASTTTEVRGKKLDERMAFTLLEVENQDIANEATIQTFTSKLWTFYYPIARTLQSLSNDLDRAVKELYLYTTKGRWLEYWASFFGLKRLLNEDDDNLRRRILVTIANVKTNNIAITQLIRYRLKDYRIQTRDVEPATFEVVLDKDYVGRVKELRELVDTVKGAGIRYWLTYMNLDHDGDFVHLEYNQRDFPVPYKITNVMTTADQKGKLFKGYQRLQSAVYPLNIDYKITNQFSVVDTQKGVLRQQGMALEECSYGFAVAYPICNTFTTFRIADIQDAHHFTIAEEYRDNDVVYKRAGVAYTGEGEI